MRLADRWQAARRQAERRRDAQVKARHAQAERARRQRAKSTPQTVDDPAVTPARGHAADRAAEGFFSLPLCDRPGCHAHPASSPQNPARYCYPACRQAVCNVHDRERKWLSRNTNDGRKRQTQPHNGDEHTPARHEPRNELERENRPDGRRQRNPGSGEPPEDLPSRIVRGSPMQRQAAKDVDCATGYRAPVGP
jgi:hypothetical protein